MIKEYYRFGERLRAGEHSFNGPDVVAKNINDQTSIGELANIPNKNSILCEALFKVPEDVTLQL